MKRRAGKRILIISDSQCGHRVGLTHPDYQDPRGSKYGNLQREMWNAFEEWVDARRPYDILLFNADAIDGKGELSGGTEQITTDRKVQCDMARKVLELPNAPVIRMTYGTKYHTGKKEDWEDVLAESVKAQITSHGYYTIEGVNFDMKHKLSSSTIPHGSLTPLAKEILWALYWHLLHGMPRPDVLIRSHTHKYDQIDHDGVFGITTSSLQGLGTKYGERECSGVVDFGIQVMDVCAGKRTFYEAPRMTGLCQIPIPEVL